MQITERMYPVLSCLKSERIGKWGSQKEDMKTILSNVEFFKSVWNKNINLYKKNIFYIARSLDDSICNASKNLMTPELQKEIGEVSGTILSAKYQYCYKIRSAEHGFDAEIFVFFENIFLAFLSNDFSFYSSDLKRWAKSANKTESTFIMEWLIATILFLKYAKVEEKELKPSGRHTISGEKFINNSRNTVIVVDSLWFTTLVKSGAFKVRGHFRLQPYKDRKELIWISDFEKHGYTRNAKKLSFVNEEVQS